MYLNNIMAVISEYVPYYHYHCLPSPLTLHPHSTNQPTKRYAEAKSPDGPTFLFLFETDVDRRAALERGVKTYWVEQIEGKCNPGASRN